MKSSWSDAARVVACVVITALCSQSSAYAQASPQGSGRVVYFQAGGGITSGTTPITGGGDTQVCYNDGGVMSCGDSDFAWIKASNTLALGAAAVLRYPQSSTLSIAEQTTGYQWNFAGVALYPTHAGYTLGTTTNELGGLYLGDTGHVTYGAAQDLITARDAANTLAQRNGTNAQVSRIYSTYTDASNYERLSFSFSGGIPVIQPEAAGTGSARALAIYAAASTLYLGNGGGQKWTITEAHLLPATDNTADVGASAQAVKDVYVDGRIYSGGIAFASLGTPANGTLVYCTDCTFADPCAGSGTGAFAKRLNGAWRCD